MLKYLKVFLNFKSSSKQLEDYEQALLFYSGLTDYSPHTRSGKVLGLYNKKPTYLKEAGRAK